MAVVMGLLGSSPIYFQQSPIHPPVGAVIFKPRSVHALSSHSLPLEPPARAVKCRPRSVHTLSSPSLPLEPLKKLAAERAVDFVNSGMVLGLGTGSTAAYAITRISELLNSGTLHDITGVPTSQATATQATSLRIPLIGLDSHPRLDLAIDGADEVDPSFNLVKGRGGALLREKMVEAASDKFVVIVDESKLVDSLGGSGLAMPVEVVQFCWKYNLQRLQQLFKDEGCEAKLRVDLNGAAYVTDNSNYIIDLYFKRPIDDPEAAAKEISSLEGVVEHGLFIGMADAVVVAGMDGVTVKTC